MPGQPPRPAEVTAEGRGHSRWLVEEWEEEEEPQPPSGGEAGWAPAVRGGEPGPGSKRWPWRSRDSALASPQEGTGRPLWPARRPVRLPLSSGKAARPFRAAPDEGRAWRALGPGRFRPVRGQPLARRDLVAAAGGLWARAAQPHFSPFHPSQASVPDNPLAPLPPSQRRRNGRANPWAREPRRQAPRTASQTTRRSSEFPRWLRKRAKNRKTLNHPLGTCDEPPRRPI